jgi:serine/threonine protein kinase/TolB-like protein/Tfp pilus assembly protein PilF
MSSVTKQALEIIDAALELSPVERSAYLDSVCLDSSLRQYIDSLLSSYEEAEGFLSESALVTHASVLEAESMDSWLGRRIGPYQLTDEIGEGGMGVVYHAVRADEQYRKEVAIKLLRSGFDSNSTLARFKAERQILASLEHPNIARLLDGGATSEGSPYLVMELVDGLPIDEYCDLHKLPTIERLKLFRAVCSAVQYAHDRSVIHRDLKPRNVLVTRDGVPKLLDFGIAKILDPISFPGTKIEPTLTMMRLFTPEYASPEQMRGEPTGPVSDVYSLGVILYIVLTGHRPYNLKNRSPHDVAQAVCDIDPAKPSTVLSRVEEVVNADGTTMTLTPETVGSTRDESVDRLRRQLTGDVDNIVLNALRKEPQRRYASANELSEDIRRHLENLPVLARRDTALYRLGKFVRRNAPVVSAAFALVLVMALGITSFAWLKHNAGRAPVARTSPINMRPSIAVLGFTNLSGRERAAWLSTALSEMLNTELAAGEKLRTISGENVARMKTDLTLADSESYAPDTLGRIRTNLGADYVIVGSYFETEAGPGARVRLDLRLQDAATGEILTSVSESGREPDLGDIVARAANSLRVKLAVGETTTAEASTARAAIPSDPAARLYADGLTKLRNFDALGARSALEQSVVADPRFALAHSALADAWSQLGYDVKAADESKRALELSAGLAREDRLWIEARYSEAAHDWTKAIQLYSTLYNFFPDNLDYGLRLADAQTKAGKGNDALLTVQTLRKLPAPTCDSPAIDFAEALAAESVSDYERERTAATNGVRKADGAGMRSLAARALLAEGYSQRALAQPEKAIASVTLAKQIFEQVHDRGGAAKAANSMGIAFYDSGDLLGAKKAYEESLRVYRDIGNGHGTAAVLSNLAEVVGDLGDQNDSIKLGEQALAIFRQIGEKTGMGNALIGIGGTLISQGDLSLAAQALQQALAIKRETGDQDGVAYCLANMGVVSQMRGEINKAKINFEEAINIRRSSGHLGAIGYPLESLGEIAAAGGDLSGAKQHLAETLTIARQSGDKQLAALAIAKMGEIELQEGDFTEARKSYQQALEMWNALGKKGNAEETELAIAELALEEGNSGDTRTLSEKALREFTAETLRDDQIFARVLLARVFLVESKTPDAQKEIHLAKRIAAKSQNRFAQLKLAIVSARADFASRKTTQSIKALEAALADAKKHGLVPLQFEASLALGEIELTTGRVKVGQERLDRLQREATEKGFGLMARKAVSTRKSAGL